MASSVARSVARGGRPQPQVRREQPDRGCRPHPSSPKSRTRSRPPPVVGSARTSVIAATASCARPGTRPRAGSRVVGTGVNPGARAAFGARSCVREGPNRIGVAEPRLDILQRHAIRRLSLRIIDDYHVIRRRKPCLGHIERHDCRRSVQCCARSPRPIPTDFPAIGPPGRVRRRVTASTARRRIPLPMAAADFADVYRTPVVQAGIGYRRDTIL